MNKHIQPHIGMMKSFFGFVLNVWRLSTDFCYVSATSCVSNKGSTRGGLWSPASSLLGELVLIPDCFSYSKSEFAEVAFGNQFGTQYLKY